VDQGIKVIELTLSIQLLQVTLGPGCSGSSQSESSQIPIPTLFQSICIYIGWLHVSSYCNLSSGSSDCMYTDVIYAWCEAAEILKGP
jgi:hypothetical protein